jgi:hypothetical protein
VAIARLIGGGDRSRRRSCASPSSPRSARGAVLFCGTAAAEAKGDVHRFMQLSVLQLSGRRSAGGWRGVVRWLNTAAASAVNWLSGTKAEARAAVETTPPARRGTY